MIIDNTCPEKNYFIYKITNNINGKVYIGRTTQTIQKRWFVHQCHAKYDYTKNKKTVEKTKNSVQNRANSDRRVL